LKVFPQIQTNTNHKPMQTLAKFHKTLNKWCDSLKLLSIWINSN
jgi:hypothetical protein